MSTTTEPPAADAVIRMTRVYDAPRSTVWEAMTKPKHVAQWWGGPGFTNPVCEMDVRPGGRWRHVMRFPDGHELRMEFVFLEVDAPGKLVWRPVDHANREESPPTSVITVTLEDLGEQTRWTMVAQFLSVAERDAAAAMGFGKPIEASSDRLVDYLKRL